MHGKQKTAMCLNVIYILFLLCIFYCFDTSQFYGRQENFSGEHLCYALPFLNESQWKIYLGMLHNFCVYVTKYTEKQLVWVSIYFGILFQTLIACSHMPWLQKLMENWEQCTGSTLLPRHATSQLLHATKPGVQCFHTFLLYFLVFNPLKHPYMFLNPQAGSQF